MFFRLKSSRLFSSPHRVLRSVLALSLLFFLMGAGVSAVLAQDINPAITVSPLILEFDIEEGKRYEHAFQVSNSFSSDYQIHFEAFDVEIEPESHNVEFLPEVSKRNVQKSLASWIKPRGEISFVLPSQLTRRFIVDIEVPRGIDTKDYYASVNFYFTALDQSSGEGVVQVRQSIGSLLLASMGDAGDVSSGEETEYSFSDLSEEIQGDEVKVSVGIRNDSLRYVHLRPLLRILDQEGAVYFQSQGDSKRIFPGEFDELSHSFPLKYLGSSEPLHVSFQLWDRLGKKKYFEKEQPLESNPDLVFRLENDWLNSVKYGLLATVFVILGFVFWIRRKRDKKK